MCTEEQEEDVEEQDDHVGEDDEEEEEDKGDGSTHATVVADLTETAKPQLQENEKPSRRTKPDKPGKDEGKDEGKRGGDDPDEKKKRRTPNTYLPQANQRSIGAPFK